jgi:hypothetical protein
MTEFVKIFRIYITELPNYCFVSHTTSSISQVLKNHRDCARFKLFPTHNFFLPGHNAVIELLELTTHSQLPYAREEWINEFPSCINRQDKFIEFQKMVSQVREDN